MQIAVLSPKLFKSCLPFLLTIISMAAFAQNWPQPCGTQEGRSEWLKEFQQRKDVYAAKNDPIVVAIQPHLVGSARPFSFLRYLESMSTLETDFDSSGIRFVLASAPDTVLDAGFNDHPNVLAGADYMFQYNHPNALNLYFLSNPAGNCGYNLRYAGIAIANQCAGINSNTTAHEVGHALAIPHPFLGWEGGQTHDGSRPAVFSRPAPRRVTYDYTYFRDTLIRDTIIIDTAEVELVARTNCTVAADGFCDTEPDYIAARWTCSGGRSASRQLDPDSVEFRSDGSLIMGYSNDECQTRFTPQQISAMHAFAREQRSSWLRTGVDTSRVFGYPELHLNERGFTREGFRLTFSRPAHATHTLVQISERRSFNPVLLEVVTQDTFLNLPSNFVIGEDYYFRAYAFNHHSFRAGLSTSTTFQIEEGSSTAGIADNDVVPFPNPIRAGNALVVGKQGQISTWDWFDSFGRVVASSETQSDGQLMVPAGLSPGVYLLKSEQKAHRILLIP